MEISSNKNYSIEFPGLPIELLSKIYTLARKLSITDIAVVGGAVRDELIGNLYNYKLKPKDIDLLVEGSAIELAEALRNELGKERISKFIIHSAYKTVEMEIDEISIDLASAREENYNSPGDNPTISYCNIKKDLFRRDFTINSIALKLSEMKLIDPFGGQESIKKKEIEFLHNKSVADDPTRIIRAARYSSRLNFQLTIEAVEQIKKTISNWPWSWSHGNDIRLAPPSLATRLRLELELLIKEKSWKIALTNLQNWNAFYLLDIGLQFDTKWEIRLQTASELKVSLITALVSGAKDPITLSKRLQLPKKQLNTLYESIKIKHFLSDPNSTEECQSWSPSIWCQEIEKSNWNKDSIALAICEEVPFANPLYQWWSNWRLVKSPVTARELIKQGWLPGAELGAELNRLRFEEIDKSQKQIS